MKSLRFTKLYIIRKKGVWWKHKIGVSVSAAGRAAGISQKHYVVIWLPMINAYEAETVLHRFFSPIHAPNSKESGGTEWFFSLNPIAALAVFAFTFSPYSILVALIPIALDAFICMVILCAAQWIWVTALVASVAFLASLI